MPKTYEEAKEKSKTCRVQSGKRRSIGPCEVPFKDFKVQLPETEVIKGERKATKDGKLEENGKDKGTKANCGDGVNKKDQDNSNESSCSSSTSDSSDDDAEDKNDQDVQKDEDDQNDEGDQKDEDDQNDEGDQKDKDAEKDQDDQKDQDNQNNEVDISAGVPTQSQPFQAEAQPLPSCDIPIHP
ncbi:Halomucin [Frankliniella fusca]|uniref:Halomucin n=1 Tax=Frankliniella fusca TaxID=407009 RepID=A0AAE1HEF5_9NEOP|nr:Halomucin [Frankliniella fusca]